MRIVDIRECAIPLKSDMRNSSFDFSEMTTSVVAVITDVARDGKPVIGFAFNSTAAMPAVRRCAHASSLASSAPIRDRSLTRHKRISIREKFSPS